MNDKKSDLPKVIIRPTAVRDIEYHAEYLEANATLDVAQRFRTAIMKAVDHLGLMPLSGSPREVTNPRLDGLRMWGVPGFRNYLLFYVTPNGGVEIIRLFHGAQDIDTILEADEE